MERTLRLKRAFSRPDMVGDEESRSSEVVKEDIGEERSLGEDVQYVKKRRRCCRLRSRKELLASRQVMDRGEAPHVTASSQPRARSPFTCTMPRARRCTIHFVYELCMSYDLRK
jgi:hypothetical protein